MQDDHDDTDTPGWDAINAALAPLYAGQEPRHFGTALPYTLGGQDPLDGISVYWADAPVPHWHYITYGFSELYAKESSDADASGYGFELTFRLAAEAGENAGSTPPVWPMNLLQNLARYVFFDDDAARFFDDWDAIADDVAAMLRVEVARAPGGAAQQLVDELTEGSEAFARRWRATRSPIA